ncbi:hypothetical protein ACEPAI_7265 [Sanghuangporus weigelae]
MSQYSRSKAKSELFLSSANSASADSNASTVTNDSKENKFRLPRFMRRSRSPESEEPPQAQKLASSRNKMSSWKIQVSNHTVPPEQEERYVRTRERLKEVSQSILGYGSNAAHDVLEISSELFSAAPVNGLGAAAKTLLYIWDALELVESNQLACLSITERCVDTLIILRDEISNAGVNVESQLEFPMMQLNNSFNAVKKLVEDQAHRPFYKRYLKRKEIQEQIEACDARISNALDMFSLKVQIRSLQRMEEAESSRRAAEFRTRQDLQKVLDYLPEKVKEQEKLAISQVMTIADLEPIEASEPSEHKEMKNPPTASDIRRKIDELVLKKNNWDFALDLAELRRLMRESLEYSSDDALRDLLQVEREEVHDVLKEMQRALEENDDGHVESKMKPSRGSGKLSEVPALGISRASTLPVRWYEGGISDELDRTFIEHSIRVLKRSKTA